MLTPEDVTNVVQLAPGVFCGDDVLDIVAWVREYDPQLDVLYLDPNRHDLAPDDPPYKIVERCRDGFTRVVMSCWTLDERVKERIWAADNQRHNILLTLDEHNAKAKTEQERRYSEVKERDADLIGHILKNPKTTYTFRNERGELIRLEDNYGIVRRKT